MTRALLRQPQPTGSAAGGARVQQALGTVTWCLFTVPKCVDVGDLGPK